MGALMLQPRLLVLFKSISRPVRNAGPWRRERCARKEPWTDRHRADELGGSEQIQTIPIFYLGDSDVGELNNCMHPQIVQKLRLEIELCSISLFYILAGMNFFNPATIIYFTRDKLHASSIPRWVQSKTSFPGELSWPLIKTKLFWLKETSTTLCVKEETLCMIVKDFD